MAPGPLLLVCATLLLAASASGSVQDVVDRLSVGCRAGIDASGAVEEIRLGQEEVGDMVTGLERQLLSGGGAEQQCPAGWTRHLDACYLIPLARSSWYEATHHCAALDRRARLAVVTPSAAEFTEQLVMTSTRASYGAWIGLVRLEAAGTFGWLDGSRPVAARWNQGEPSGDGDCVHIWGPGHAGASGWNDLPCSTADAHILCQIPLK